MVVFKNMKVVSFLLVLVIVLSVGCTAKPKQENVSTNEDDVFHIRVGSSALGMAQQVVGTAIGTVVNEKAKGILKVDTLVTGGSIENPRLMDKGELEMMSTAMAYEAYNGLKPFEKPYKFSFVAPYYFLSYVFITLEGSGIENIQDLAGKRVDLSDPGGAVPAVAEAMLKGAGVYDKVKISHSGYDDGVDQLRDGLVDAVAIYLASTPPAYVEKISRIADIAIVNMDRATLDKVVKDNPQYFVADISSMGLNMKYSTPCYAIGLAQGCFVRDDLPVDVVYTFTKIMMENLSTIKKYTAQIDQVTPENALDGIPAGIPVHAGAAKYYKEIGVWKEGLSIVGEE